MLCPYITRNQKPFSSSAHSDAIKAAHKELHILSVKVTHGGRVYGRQQLEQCGVDKVSADVAGGWSTGAGEGCYGNGLSRPAMRAMAGFPHDDSAFYLPRASLEPPESLQQMIFPQLDNWIIRHRDGDECDTNFALNGYLRLLSWFRIVILQDAAMMIDSYEHDILFSHAIFSNPEFLSYKYSLQERVRLQQNPLEKQIQRVLPELCRQITNNNNTLKDQIIKTMLNCTEDMKSQLRSTEQNINVTVHRIQTAITACLDNALTTFQELPDTIDTEANHVLDSVHEQRRMEGDSEAQEYVTQPEEIDQVPLFGDIISSATTTIPEILMEWEVGRNGFPSIASMEEHWKTKWRQGQWQQKAFSRRKVLYNLITSYAATKRITMSEAARFIEEKRKQNKLSIRHISDKWKQFQQQHLS